MILQPNFQVTAFDPVSDEVLLNLERFAERVSSDRAVELRLTQSSVYNAQLQGWDIDRIERYLEEITGLPVPENVQRTLEDWQTQHERITIYPEVTLLHAALPGDLDDLEQDQGLKEWITMRPDPSVAVISGQLPNSDFVSALVAKEWLPLISTGDYMEFPRVVEVFQDGLLRFELAEPDFYLQGHLRRFADPVGGYDYRITPASVQRAVLNGMTAPDIIAALAQVAKKDIPPDLENHILAWSGHFGEAAIEEVVLLKMQNDSILSELFADPEIGPLLKPISKAADQAAAIVNPGDLSRLRQLLDEKGIRQN